MSEMFKNYPQPDDYIPNNRPRCCKPFKLDIMVGETSVHSFDIPFNVEEDCVTYSIIYKLGIEDVVIKKKDDISVIKEEDETSILSCTLSPAETKLFNSTVLDTHVQLKFVMKDNSTIFSEIYKVRIRNSLEKKEQPEPQIISGIGYTED